MSDSILKNWDTVKSLRDGYLAVSQTRTDSVDWNAASNFCTATVTKKKTTLFQILCRGTSHGYIIRTRKRKDRMLNIDIRLLLMAKKFKTHPPAKEPFLIVFLGFWKEGATVNSSHYIQTLKHLRRQVCRVGTSLPPIILQ